jgi:hypothetical protein
MLPVNTTGLQASHAGVVALLRQWEAQLSPREYATLVDLLSRYLEVERERNERAHRRWAA